MQQELDLRGLKCPMPMLRTKKALASLPSGTVITVHATDPNVLEDFTAFCRHTGHKLLSHQEENGVYILVLERK